MTTTYNYQVRPLLQLNSIDQLSLSDFIAVANPTQYTARKSSLSQVLTLLEENLSNGLTTQGSSPNVDAFTVDVIDNGTNIWLLLRPTGTFANGTIVLPNVNVSDQQEISINSTQEVTSLSVTAGVLSVVGAPVTLLQNDFFLMRYDASSLSWYRVG